MTTRSAEKSVEIFEERLKKNPNSWVFSRLADAYREEGDFPKAIEVCLNGLQIHPEYVTGRLILGSCYLRQENYDQAMDEFKKICSVDRQNRVAIKSLAEIFTQKGDEQKANELYAILYKIDPAGSAVLKPGMHLPSEKSLLEILEIDTDLGDSQEVPGGMPQEIMDDIPQDDIANAVTTVQPSVDQYDPDSIPQEPAHSDLDSIEQYTDLTEAIPGAVVPIQAESPLDNAEIDSLPQADNSIDQLEQSFANELQADSSTEQPQLSAAELGSGEELSADDVSSRIGELFPETDNAAEPEQNQPLTFDTDFAGNQPEQTFQDNSVPDQPFVHGVTEYVDENVSRSFPEQNEAVEQNNTQPENPLDDSDSEFEETLQYDRSLIDTIRSGQNPDAAQGGEYENLNFNSEIQPQGNEGIIDFEEYSGVGADAGADDQAQNDVFINEIDFSSPKGAVSSGDIPVADSSKQAVDSNLDNLIADEDASDLQAEAVGVNSDDQVSGDDIVHQLESLFADSEPDENSGNEQLLDKDEKPRELIEDVGDSEVFSKELNLENTDFQAVVQPGIAEDNSSEFVPEITDVNDSSVGMESALVEPWQGNQDISSGNAGQNTDNLLEESFFDSQIDSGHRETQSMKAVDSNTQNPEFSVEDMGAADEGKSYSDGNSYETDNLLLEQISGNDVAQQLDSIFSDVQEPGSGNDDLFVNLGQGHENSGRKTDRSNIEPEIGIHVYGEETDSVDGPIMISGTDITSRLEELFPKDNPFDVAGNAVIPEMDEPEEEESFDDEFYSIADDSVGNEFGDKIEAGIDEEEVFEQSRDGKENFDDIESFEPQNGSGDNGGQDEVTAVFEGPLVPDENTGVGTGNTNGKNTESANSNNFDIELDNLEKYLGGLNEPNNEEEMASVPTAVFEVPLVPEEDSLLKETLDISGSLTGENNADKDIPGSDLESEFKDVIKLDDEEMASVPTAVFDEPLVPEEDSLSKETLDISGSLTGEDKADKDISGSDLESEFKDVIKLDGDEEMASVPTAVFDEPLVPEEDCLSKETLDISGSLTGENKADEDISDSDLESEFKDVIKLDEEEEMASVPTAVFDEPLVPEEDSLSKETLDISGSLTGENKADKDISGSDLESEFKDVIKLDEDEEMASVPTAVFEAPLVPEESSAASISEEAPEVLDTITNDDSCEIVVETDSDKSENSDVSEPMKDVVSEIFDDIPVSRKDTGTSFNKKLLDTNARTKIGNAEFSLSIDPVDNADKLSETGAAKIDNAAINKVDGDTHVEIIENTVKPLDSSKMGETLDMLIETFTKNLSNANTAKKEEHELEKPEIKALDSEKMNSTADIQANVQRGSDVMQAVTDNVPDEIDNKDKSYSIPDHVLTPTLADIYFHQGQTELAIQLYERLIKRDPDNETLVKKLEQIKNAADATITEAVFYPEAEKGKGNALPAKKGITRKKKTDDPRPLAGVRIKKDKRPVLAKKRSDRSKTK